MAVLKAGAYGHDIKQIGKALDSENVAFFGVASVIEARKLAKIGVSTRIYLLGATFPDERAEVVAHRWTPCISSVEEAEHFNQLNNGNAALPIHITLDTGMGRGGFLPHTLNDAVETLRTFPNISIEGIGSHLPSADEDKEFTQAQFQTFEQAVKGCDFVFRYIHLSNSAGLLDYQSDVTNLVRPGLMLYGSSPIPEYSDSLKPVMSLKSRISIVRELPKGHGISYGRSTILEKDSRIATIGIGYGDGYPRCAGFNQAEVYIRGQRAPILGRITMDQIMVDVTHIPDAASGDEVELFGSNIPVSEVATKANTIPWEILTRITPRVTKVYLS